MIKIDKFCVSKFRPGVSAPKFSLLTTRAVEGGGAGTVGETIAAAGLKNIENISIFCLPNIT